MSIFDTYAQTVCKQLGPSISKAKSGTSAEAEAEIALDAVLKLLKQFANCLNEPLFTYLRTDPGWYETIFLSARSNCWSRHISKAKPDILAYQESV